MQTRCKVLSVVLWITLAASVAPALVVDAVPPIACTFYGTAKLNGLNVPDGTVVSVWSADWSTKWAETTTFTPPPPDDVQGTYVVNVNGDDDETSGVIEGPVGDETVRFKIGDYEAVETSTWQENSTKPVNLTATGATPTPSHTPTEGATATNTPTATETPEGTPTYTPTPGPPVTKVFQQGQLPGPGSPTEYDGCQDCYITSGDAKGGPDDPHDAVGLWIHTHHTHKPILKFDLVGEIPVGCTVESAVLEIRTAWHSEPFDVYVAAHKVLKNWEETEATWNNPTLSSAWGSPGANASSDRSANPAFTTTVTEATGWAQWTLTDLVQEWVNDPGSNHGVILVGSVVTHTVSYSFYDSEFGSAAFRPKLSVTYRELPPTPTVTATPTSSPTPEHTYTPTPSRTPTASLTPTHTPSTGRIYGVVYEDLNTDGELTSGEPGLPGAGIELRSAANQLLDSRTTGSSGTYVFDFLYSGTYQVQVTFPVGYHALVPDPPYVSITVGPGSNRHADFGCIEQPYGALLPLVLKGNWSGVLSQRMR